jgi:1-acyl-sn-glycerol-3-phosphate acyltransferase
MPALGWGMQGWWRRTRAVGRLLRVLFHVLYVSFVMPRAFAKATDQARDALVRHWSARVLHCLGVQAIVHGDITPATALVVSNHVSWLDIMTINAVLCCRFVSKKEVAAWPLIGPIVTLAGTLYVDRSKRHDARRVLQDMATHLQNGHALGIFPESTTGTGPQLLHFHANLLQAAVDAHMPIQPLVIRYEDTQHVFSPSPVYVGDTNLLQSLWWIACAEQLKVHVQVLPISQPPHLDRRTLCAQLHHQMAQALRQPSVGAASQAWSPHSMNA